MKMKIGFIVASTLFLIVISCISPLAFAQTYYWCVVNAQSTDLVVDETNGVFSFTVISADPGTTNSISAAIFGGENYEEFLSPGDTVVVRNTGFVADDLVVFPGSGHLIYQGPADSVTINTVEIPEFPSFLILPLFMIATLLAAIVYRRKCTSQVKQRID